MSIMESEGSSGAQRKEGLTSVYAGYNCGASLCPKYNRGRELVPAIATNRSVTCLGGCRYRSYATSG